MKSVKHFVPNILKCPLNRVVNIAVLLISHVLAFATNSIGDTFHILVQVSAVLFVCSIDIDTIGDTFTLMFWQYSIPILLSSVALVTLILSTTLQCQKE